MSRLITTKQLIFGLIGLFNTAFDIALFTVLRSIGYSVLVANLVSVSAALVGSYLLNAHFTFKQTAWTARRFAAFVGVTLFGLWILQTIVIYAAQPLVMAIPGSLLDIFGSFSHTLQIIIPKLLATAVTFVWNYLWYNKVIFRQAKQPAENVTTELL